MDSHCPHACPSAVPCTNTLQVSPRNVSGTPHIAVSPDGLMVVVAPGYDTVAVYDLESETVAHELKVGGVRVES